MNEIKMYTLLGTVFSCLLSEIVLIWHLHEHIQFYSWDLSGMLILKNKRY